MRILVTKLELPMKEESQFMEIQTEQVRMADVVVRGNGKGFAQEIAAGAHRFAVDEPVEAGGTDTGPGPYQLLLAALGACTSITVTMYAKSKGWPLEIITVSLSHSKEYAADCANCETKQGPLNRIDREIEFGGPLTAEQKQRLFQIANKGPVHRALTSEIDIRTRLKTVD